MNSTLRRLAPLSALAIVASAGIGSFAAATSDDSGSVLDTVRANGVVRCGVRPDLPGFNNVDESGEHVGFEEHREVALLLLPWVSSGRVGVGSGRLGRAGRGR